MDEAAEVEYRFGSFRFIPTERLLLLDQEQVNLPGRALDILQLLIKRRKHLVTKDEILEAVWGLHTNVEEGNVGVQISTLRRALGGASEQYIETVHGEGYRFVADVIEQPVSTSGKGRTGRLRIIATTVAVILAIAASAFLYKKYKSPSPLKETRHSIVLTSLVSDSALAHYELAHRYQTQGDDEQALAALSRATSISPDFGEAYLYSAFISNEVGREDQARKYLNLVERTAAYKTDYIKLKADALKTELNDTYDEARKKYRLLVDSYPNDVSAKYYLADLAMQRRRHFAEARDVLQDCLQIDPTNPFCAYDQMVLDVLENRFAQSIETHRRLKSAGVNHPWLYQPLSLALYGKGDFAAALDAVQKLSKGRTHGLVHLTTAKEWAADIDLFQGRIASAKKQLRQLSVSDTPYERATHLLYLAKVDMLLGNNRAARDEIQSAIELSGDRDIALEAASLLAIVGSRREVLALLKRTGEEPPRNISPEFRYFVSGNLAFTEGKFPDAVADLVAAHEIDDDISTQYLLAKALLAAQEWTRAITLLKDLENSKGRIIADRGYPPIIWPLSKYQLAVAYDNLGNKSEALAYYVRFISAWALADPDLPLLQHAKKREAELRILN